MSNSFSSYKLLAAAIAIVVFIFISLAVFVNMFLREAHLQNANLVYTMYEDILHDLKDKHKVVHSVDALKCKSKVRELQISDFLIKQNCSKADWFEAPNDSTCRGIYVSSNRSFAAASDTNVVTSVLLVNVPTSDVALAAERISTMTLAKYRSEYSPKKTAKFDVFTAPKRILTSTCRSIALIQIEQDYFRILEATRDQ